MELKVCFTVVLFLILHGSDIGKGAKITMLPGLGGSHVSSLKVIGEELASRGHEVIIFIPDIKGQKKNTLQMIGFDGGVSKEEVLNMSRLLMSNSKKSIFDIVKALPTAMEPRQKFCESMAVNKDINEAMSWADLIIADVTLHCTAQLIAPHGKKWIGTIPMPLDSITAEAFKIPINPSYHPSFQEDIPIEMNFIQRVKNFLRHKVRQFAVTTFSDLLFYRFRAKMNISSDVNMYMSMNEAQMLISSCDFVYDYPIPLFPNTVCVGAFQTEPAKNLSTELEAFVNSREGFIVVTFGTVFTSLTQEQVRRMAKAFGRLNQSVIWQLQDAYDVTLPSNVRVMKWLPQNDLLGHAKIKLFVSHLGVNSMQQAVYHGIPVLAVPRFGDQWSSSYKLSRRLEMAEVVNIEDVTEEELFQKIQLVLSTDRYKVNAQIASKRVKSRKQSPMQLAGDLIEYVIDNDYDVSFLRPRGLDLPWYIHDMWDIYLFLLVLLLICTLVIYFILKMFFRVCMRRKLKAE